VCAVTLLTLFILGAVKEKIAEEPWLKGGLVMLGQGIMAGGVAYFIGQYAEVQAGA
jgi:VIT1/CCC1 family predicted Fe2+/Mn2+ transporter